jgi:hypothetical protein
MLSRNRPQLRTSGGAARRPAKAALALLLALPVMLLAMALAFYAAELVETRTQLRNATDAAALAAAQTLVDDRLLLNAPALMPPLLTRARQNAQEYAQLNLVFGQGLPLDPNLRNHPDGDIVFGTLAWPRSKTFLLPDLSKPMDPAWLAINTVRVTGHRNQRRGNPMWLHKGPLLSLAPDDAAAVSTATLDRDIIGFRPMGWQPMPLAPIALFSDPPGLLRHSWEFQVEKKRGADSWRILRQGRHPQIGAGGDGLHEMETYLGSSAMRDMHRAGGDNLNRMLRQGQFSCCLLHLNNGNNGGNGSEFSYLAQQLIAGISPADLPPAWGGQLMLNPNNQLRVAGTPWGPSNESSDAMLLQSALNTLQLTAEMRLWPLFSSFDPSTGLPVLSGFVAARVVQVQAVSKKGRGITFSVQPCMMSTATALTDFRRRGIGSARLPNPYICKVRLVE